MFIIFFLIIFIGFINGCIDDSELKEHSLTGEKVKGKQENKDNTSKIIIPLNLLERFSSYKVFLLFFIILISVYTVWYKGNIKIVILFFSSIWILCLIWIYWSLIRKIDNDLILGVKCIEESNKVEYKKEVGKIREKIYKYFQIALILGFVIFLAYASVVAKKGWNVNINDTVIKSFIGVGTAANLISVISGLNSLDNLFDTLLWKYDEKNFLYYQRWSSNKDNTNPLKQLLKKINFWLDD